MKIKILVDEMLSYLSPWLRGFGWEVIEEEKGAKDDAIIKFAKAKKAIIVTKDIKLERTCVKEGVPCYRLYLSPKYDAVIVDQNLRNIKNALEFYKVIAKDEIVIQPPPILTDEEKMEDTTSCSESGEKKQ